jgi:hypothetical protein
MQLVAYGAQDIYLTGNPMITYFKVVYRRHTNFAMEAIQQTFNGTADFGNKVTALISRNGDLIHSMYVQAELPDLQEVPSDAVGGTALASTNDLSAKGAYKRYTRWVDNVGHHLLKQVEVEIGGQLIDRQYGDWLDIWAQLTVPAGKRVGYYQMIGQDPLNALGQNTGLQADVYNADSTMNSMTDPTEDVVIKGRTVYVPLQFWFCRNVGLALPLIALQYHEVKVNVTFREAYELVMLNKSDEVNDGVAEWDTSKSGFNSGCTLSGTLNASLWVDYIYLDTDERRRFAQVSHEYLIEQLQFTGDESITPGTPTNPKSNSLKLNFNHPVKELVWVVKAFEDRKEWSNFTDTGLPAIPPFQVLSGATEIIPGLPTASIATGTLGDVATLADVARLTNYNSVRPLGKPLDGNTVGLAGNPVDEAKLQLNGHDRFAARPGTYFNWVQCRQHHSNIPASPGINVYSFALKPEDHQPSGTCNFSRIDNATLQLKVGAFYQDGADTTSALSNVIARVYAVNYNVLRIMSGMGGLAYSN